MCHASSAEAFGRAYLLEESTVSDEKVHVEDKVERGHPEEEEVGEDAPKLILFEDQPVVEIERKGRDNVEVACGCC